MVLVSLVPALIDSLPWPPANALQWALVALAGMLGLGFGCRGWSRGLLYYVWRLLSVGIAVAAGWLLAPLLTVQLSLGADWPTWIRSLVFGLVTGGLVYGILEWLGRGLFRDPQGRPLRPGFLSRVGGFASGLALGLAIVMLLGVGLRWCATMAGVQEATAGVDEASGGPGAGWLRVAGDELMAGEIGEVLRRVDPTPPTVYRTSGKFVEVLGNEALHPVFLSHPEVTRFLNDPAFVEAAGDERLIRLVGERRYAEVLADDAFQKLVLQPHLRRSFESVPWERVLDEVLASDLEALGEMDGEEAEERPPRAIPVESLRPGGR